MNYKSLAFSYLGSICVVSILGLKRWICLGPIQILPNQPRSFGFVQAQFKFCATCHCKRSLKSNKTLGFHHLLLQQKQILSQRRAKMVLTLSLTLTEQLLWYGSKWLLCSNYCYCYYYCMLSRPTRHSWLRRSWLRRWGRIGLFLTGSAWGLTIPSGSLSIFRFFVFVSV